MVLFPAIAPLEMALLATILAPTDAALGKPVVTNPDVPAALREGLNIESGLNDGICVPIVVLLLGLAVGTQIEHGTLIHAVRVVVEELGVGAAVGLGLTWLTTLLLRFAERQGWIGEHWEEVPIVALAAACFAAAQAMGGSGFIACFVGGLLLSGLRRRHQQALLGGAVATGEAMALPTWIAFGVGAAAQIIGRLSLAAIVYAVLSLTVIRMVPVLLCLAGTGMRIADKLFLGWVRPARPRHLGVRGDRLQREAARQRHDRDRGRGHGAVERHRPRGEREPAGQGDRRTLIHRAAGGQAPANLAAQTDQHAVGAEAQRHPLALSMLQIDAVAVLQPHMAGPSSDSPSSAVGRLPPRRRRSRRRFSNYQPRIAQRDSPSCICRKSTRGFFLWVE